MSARVSHSQFLGGSMVPMAVLEFWPDYRAGPLWTSEGKPADLSALPLGEDLRRDLADWNTSYTEERIPVGGSGDPAWLRQGALLLSRVRHALGPAHEVVVTESWWGE